MILPEWAEFALDWLVRKSLCIKQAAYLREYAEKVHGGPAPVDWKIREGIPPHSQWPKRTDGSLKLFVGAQRHGRVRPVRVENLVTGGNRDWQKYPLVVCLCGSTRFHEAFQQANYDLTLAGKIVLSIGCNTKSDAGLGITDEQKIALDELHKRKIDLADEVLVLNVGGYIGESTRSEIEYATNCGKPVRYLEPSND